MIKPLRDVIFVTPIAREDKIGGIYITDSTKSTRNQVFVKARVVAAGPKVELATVGKTVLLSEYWDDTKQQMDGIEVWHGRERDIVGIIT
jgi:co-chaperonin GroES (HSP10)